MLGRFVSVWSRLSKASIVRGTDVEVEIFELNLCECLT